MNSAGILIFIFISGIALIALALFASIKIVLTKMTEQKAAYEELINGMHKRISAHITSASDENSRLIRDLKKEQSKQPDLHEINPALCEAMKAISPIYEKLVDMDDILTHIGDIVTLGTGEIEQCFRINLEQFDRTFNEYLGELVVRIQNLAEDLVPEQSNLDIAPVIRSLESLELMVAQSTLNDNSGIPSSTIIDGDDSLAELNRLHEGIAELNTGIRDIKGMFRNSRSHSSAGNAFTDEWGGSVVNEEISIDIITEEVKHRGVKILFVDDSKVIRHNYTKHLENLGMYIEEAVTGEHAIEVIEQQGYRPDVVIMDIEMPKMDGYDCTKYIIESSPIKEIPIIVLTAKDIGRVFPELEKRNIRVFDVVSKHDSKDAIVRRIHQLTKNLHETKSSSHSEIVRIDKIAVN